MGPSISRTSSGLEIFSTTGDEQENRNKTKMGKMYFSISCRFLRQIKVFLSIKQGLICPEQLRLENWLGSER
jgi:hypothetical protein